MSGYFDYVQNGFDELINELKYLTESEEFTPRTTDEFSRALSLAKELKVLVDRIDYLASGEETEESFHESLADDLESLEYNSMELEVQELRF